LNVDISTVSELRETCRRREAFLDDVKRAHGYSKSSPFRREISKLVPESESQNLSESENGRVHLNMLELSQRWPHLPGLFSR